MKHLSVASARSKRLVPLVLVAYFLCCLFGGGVLGTFLKTPSYPTLSGLPVYPYAEGLVDHTPKTPGLASPTPITPDGNRLLLTNFEFQTADVPDAVLSYYRDFLVKRYGFQVWSADNNTLKLVRELPNRDKQLVTITARLDRTSLTKVTAEMHTEPSQ